MEKNIYPQNRLANKYYCNVCSGKNSLVLNSNSHYGACNDFYSTDDILYFLRDYPLFNDLRTDFLNNVNETDSVDAWYRTLFSNNITTIQKLYYFVFKALLFKRYKNNNKYIT